MNRTWLQQFTAPSARQHCSARFHQLFLPRKADNTCLDTTLNTHATMSTTTSSLLDLPPELILEIHDRLALDALLALKLTHPRLNRIIRLDRQRWQTTLSHCSRRAIRIYLAPSTAKASHRYCKICTATIPVSMFDSSAGSACIQTPLTDGSKNIVQLPPGICALHVSRLTRVIRTRTMGSNEWVSKQSKLCTHCANVQEWAKCSCKCDSCAVEIVTTYIRYLNNTKECQQYRFWRDTGAYKDGDGQIWVRETVINEGNRNSVIDLPVRSESDEATTKKRPSRRSYSPSSGSD